MIIHFGLLNIPATLEALVWNIEAFHIDVKGEALAVKLQKLNTDVRKRAGLIGSSVESPEMPLPTRPTLFGTIIEKKWKYQEAFIEWERNMYPVKGEPEDNIE